ncbi:MAG: Asp-tRNA(Asn)/Glu-tRNA(Gln) amidotransferase subunit GatA [Desulfobacterales bacterium]
MKLHELTITEAAEQLRKREISAEALTRDVLERIEAVDDAVGAYLTVDPEGALAQARAADTLLAGGDAAPLTGIPIALKDVLCTRGMRTTCGSRILENFIPPYDAAVVEKLRENGAVLLGKLNMDEFAMGSSNENSAFGITRNPWDLERVPGGSSGGSAAAVAADMCLAALGSDTGGSIRQPASHCGIVGLKPTYGRVSRYGLVAFASSFDQVGPLTKTVTDCALMMEAIAGHDPRDSTSVPEAVPAYREAMGRPVTGMTVGIPVAFYEKQGLDPEVAAAIQKAVSVLEAEGLRVVDVELPHADYAVAAYYVIAPCEASSNLARYDGVRYGFRDRRPDELIAMYHATRSAGFGPEVQRRILLGTFALSAGYYDAYYGKASQVRTRIVEDFQRAFERCDLIALPVAPTPAFKIGEKVDDPLTMYLSDIFTLSANLAGVPGISVPCGFSSGGLPIGLQLLGRHFDEETLLRVAYHFEQAFPLDPPKPRLT